MAIDKAKLLEARELPEEEVDLPNVGKVIVRALTRGEVLGAKDNTGVVVEHKVLCKAMVDPTISEAEARRWMAAAPAGEFNLVMETVRRLSGLDEGAAKSDL